MSIPVLALYSLGCLLIDNRWCVVVLPRWRWKQHKGPGVSSEGKVHQGTSLIGNLALTVGGPPRVRSVQRLIVAAHVTDGPTHVCRTLREEKQHRGEEELMEKSQNCIERDGIRNNRELFAGTSGDGIINQGKRKRTGGFFFFL